MLPVFIKARRVRRHTRMITDAGMLCSFVHWPRQIATGIRDGVWKFIKEDIFGLKYGKLAALQWLFVIAPFTSYGWEGGWEHFWKHSGPLIFVLCICSFLGRRPTKKRLAIGNE